MQSVQRAVLRGTREVLPEIVLQAWAAPWAASGARPGQFLQIRGPDASGAVLRRPLPIHALDRRAGELTVQLETRGDGPRALASLGAGATAELFGPLGRAFEVDPRSRHLLLIAEGAGVVALSLLAEEAVQAGRRVALLFGAESASRVYPSSLLPDEVEYVVATMDGSIGTRGSVVDLVAGHEAWADQAFAAGPDSLLRSLAALARGRDARLGVARLGRRRGRRRRTLRSPSSSSPLRRAWLQVAVEQSIGCALATCLGCVVAGTTGPLRACREGPVFRADDLAFGELP